MYEPQVNDYVTWTKGVEGWVYFKDYDYVTIEVNVRPKNKQNYHACSLHRNERLLVVCYTEQWNELNYIMSRETIYEEKNKNYIMEMVGESTGGESDEK